MLLAELSEASGVSAASIKYYRREALLPPGRRVTATRQEYGQAHLERLALIRVLREVAGAPIARIAELTAILDDPEQPLLTALATAQLIALGIPELDGERAGRGAEHPQIAPLLAELGWPDVDSAPRRALDELLHTLEEQGMPTDGETLRRYAAPMAQIARADVASIGELTDTSSGAGPAPEVSDDVQVRRAVSGALAFDRLLRLLRSLGHASYSILRAQESGRDPASS